MTPGSLSLSVAWPHGTPRRVDAKMASVVFDAISASFPVKARRHAPVMRALGHLGTTCAGERPKQIPASFGVKPNARVSEGAAKKASQLQFGGGRLSFCTQRPCVVRPSARHDADHKSLNQIMHRLSDVGQGHPTGR